MIHRHCVVQYSCRSLSVFECIELTTYYVRCILYCSDLLTIGVVGCGSTGLRQLEHHQNLHLLLDNLNNNYNNYIDYTDHSTLDAHRPFSSLSCLLPSVGAATGDDSAVSASGQLGLLHLRSAATAAAAELLASSQLRPSTQCWAEYHGETTGLPSDPEDQGFSSVSGLDLSSLQAPPSPAIENPSHSAQTKANQLIDRQHNQGFSGRYSEASLHETTLQYGTASLQPETTTSTSTASQPSNHLLRSLSLEADQEQAELSSVQLSATAGKSLDVVETRSMLGPFSNSSSHRPAACPTPLLRTGTTSHYHHRPLFTRSHSVPEQPLDFPLDSEVEELFLEAAAASLDDPLPITPSVVLTSQHRLLQQPSSKLHSLRSDDQLYYARSTPPIPTGTALASGLRSYSSELPTTARAAAARDHLTLLNAELQAAARASSRLTDRHAHARQLQRLKNEPPLTLGRSLQLVTENAGRFRKKSVRFDPSRQAAAQAQLELYNASLGGFALEDAWMSVEDVRSGRWARWDALVKQESQDSATRDSGIETGSCFTSSEDSNRDHTGNHYYHHKKVQSLETIAKSKSKLSLN